VIIFDASYLVVLLHKDPAPAKDRENKPVTQFKERVAYLASSMDVSNVNIGVPTPAMAEVLVRAGKGRGQYVSILSNTNKFQIVPFDSRAAIEAAELIELVKTNSDKWATWAKVKFDIQIVAIAKAEAATVIYSDDQDVENLGKRLKIRVVRICDLPLPPPEEPKPIESGPIGTQTKLFESSTAQLLQFPEANAGEAASPPAVQPGDQVQTDPAHPAPVQGSDSGRADDEAAAQTEKGE
jgi:hypothetical protein